MKYLYWALLSVLVVGGIGASIYFGIQPRPIPKINFSQVENPEKLGVAIAERLNQELVASQVLLLGVMPNHIEDMQVWKAFLDKLKTLGPHFDVIVIEPNLPHKNLIGAHEEIDLKAELKRFTLGVEVALQQNKRVAVILPTIYVSQLLKGNVADRLKTEFKIKPLSFAIAHFPLSREQEPEQEIPCNVERADYDGTGALGCAIVSKARTVYRKKKMPDQYVGLMDQIGAKDYLVLLERNKK